MTSISLEKFLFLFISISYVMATATKDDFKDDGLDRGAHSDRQGLWFGPRLGKRSLALSNDDNRFLRLLEAADNLKYYYDQLPYELQADEPRVARKVIFTPKLGRAADVSQEKRTYDNVEFTPRLGRRRIPEILPVTTEDEFYRADPVMLNPMSNLFSPRLGRTIQFSPRLGRGINYDIFPEKIRLARSANATKNN